MLFFNGFKGFIVGVSGKYPESSSVSVKCRQYVVKIISLSGKSVAKVSFKNVWKSSPYIGKVSSTCRKNVVTSKYQQLINRLTAYPKLALLLYATGLNRCCWCWWISTLLVLLPQPFPSRPSSQLLLKAGGVRLLKMTSKTKRWRARVQYDVFYIKLKRRFGRDDRQRESVISDLQTNSITMKTQITDSIPSNSGQCQLRVVA